MNTDTLSIDSLNNAVQAKAVESSNGHYIIPIVALLLALVMVVSITAYFRSSRYASKRNLKSKTKDVDFDNVIRSAFGAKELYDQLKGVCHPDKFAKDPEKEKIANDIFAQVVNNKHNYDELCKLKERAIKELNIKI